MNINPNIKNMLDGVSPGRDRVSSAVRVVDGFSWRSYYSGSDVSFEFDGIPVDEIAGISYKVVEPVKFHYGYNSYTALHSSRGARMAHGTLLMNFTDPTTLYYLLDKIKTGKSPDRLTKSGNSVTDIPNIPRTLTPFLANTEFTAAQKIELLNKSWASKSSPGETFSSVPNKQLLLDHRDSVWGDSTETKGKDPFYRDPVLSPRYNSHPSGFSIKMIFGEPGSLNALTLGQETSGDIIARRQVGAVRQLKGVQIISEGLEITETGEPTRVLYEFVATDIN